MALNSDRSATTPNPGAARSTARVDVIVVTADDDLLIEIGPAFDEQYRSRPLERIAELAATLQGRRSVVVLDADGSADTRAAFAELSARHPDVPVIVIASQAKRPQWEPALQRGALSALLPREPSLRTEFAAALRVAASRASQNAGQSAALSPLPATNAAAARTATAGAPAGRKLNVKMVAGLLVLAVIAIAGIWWTQHSSDEPPGAVATAQNAQRAATSASNGGAGQPAASDRSGASAEAAAVSVSQLLSAARVAFADQHFLEPAGSSALDYFTRVLKQEPDNDEARDGVVRLFGIIRSRAELAIKAGHVDEADNLLNAVRAAAPDSDLAKDLGREVAAERPRWLASQVRAALAANSLVDAQKYLGELDALNGDKRVMQDLQQQLAARQRESALDGAAAAIHAQIVAGALLEPASANAQAALQALSAADRRSAPFQAVQHELQQALAARGRDAVRDGHLDVAERYLNAAAELGNSADVADARQQLSAARQELERATASRAAANVPAAPVAADSGAAAGPHYAKVRVRRAMEADYPPDARKAGIEGFVDVKFNVTPAGKPYNVAVLQSNPPKVFDNAALVAVRRTQFEPIGAEADGSAPLGRLRVTFKLK